MTHRTTSVQCLPSGLVKLMLNKGKVELEGKVGPLCEALKAKKFCVAKCVGGILKYLFRTVTFHIF